MLGEVMELLQIKEGATVVDGTVGHGGHAEQMLRAAGRSGTLIAFDWDREMLKKAEANLELVEGKKQFIHDDFRAIPEWMALHCSSGADAILLDFGVNLEHFEDVGRGFSFQSAAPLDMRMDRQTKETASAWLNRSTEAAIASALRTFGGEKFAWPIAKEIVRRRKLDGLRTTADLVDAVLAAVPPRLREKRIHPATRTFQAVRIVVNRELEGLQEAVIEIGRCLTPKGTMATLAYHSGEDVAAKNAFKALASEKNFSILTKRPLRPSEGEVSDNPNARSARLRAIQRGAA
jgi:16S rRNA (cytosine1402-N4)-methyltransferase